MKRILGALLCALLPGTASAEAIDQAIRANPTMAFARMLEFQRAEDDGAPTSTAQDDEWGQDAGHMAIDTCYLSHSADFRLDAGSYGPHDLVAHMQFLSSFYHVASRDLGARGYPAELWQGELDLFVASLIEIALADETIFGGTDNGWANYLTGGPAFERRIAAALDEHDAGRGRGRPFAEYEPWFCGGGTAYTVFVATEPAGGSLYRLGRFSVDLCLALGLEPFSADCEGLLTPPDQWVGVGEYGFLIHWPAGEVSCGTVDLASDDATDTPTVTLNPPIGLCNGWN